MKLEQAGAKRRLFSMVALAAGCSLAGCTVGPNYKKPAAPVPANWQVEAPFREAMPKDAVPKTAWWTVFHDDELDGLETELLSANQTLKVAVAHYRQARASAAVQNATLFPTVGIAPGASRQRYSSTRATGTIIAPSAPVTQNSWTIPFTVSYEVDLVGQRRPRIF